MKGITEIAANDKQWREIAYMICRDKDLADDMVQDMYLKLMNIDKKVNKYYITLTLRSIFIDSIRRNKSVRLNEDLPIADKSHSFEPTDEEAEILKKIEELPYHQQEFIAESFDKSLREIEAEFGINYGFIYRNIHKGIDAVLGEDKHLYKNSSLKFRKPKKDD